MSNDDEILENDIQYMLRGCDPHDAEARRHIARCIIAYVREHDGRDAEHEALRVARVEISALFAPIPGTDQWGLAARLENEADRECLWKAFNALRSVDAAIARGKE